MIMLCLILSYNNFTKNIFCLLVLILYVPDNTFKSCWDRSSRVKQALNSEQNVLLKDKNSDSAVVKLNYATI